jgi:hypothetical protein
MKPASQKLRVYETLHALNQGFEEVLTDLGRLEKLGFRREFLREFRVVVEETRAWANFELMETMAKSETGFVSAACAINGRRNSGTPMTF